MIENSRQIARAAMAWPFDPDSLAQSTPRDAVTGAIESFRKAMTPACQLTKAERIADQQTLAKDIRSIGLRIRPDFNEDQARMWIASMVEALEQQPLRVAIAATREAKHSPIAFPGQALGIILEKCEAHHASYRRAIRNLERLLEAIDAPPKIEASDEAKAQAQIISDAELQEMPAHMRSFGLSCGFLIEQDDGQIRWASDEEQEARRQRIADERRIARARA